MKRRKTQVDNKKFELIQFIYILVDTLIFKIDKLHYNILMFNNKCNKLIKLKINDIPMFICLKDQGLSKDLYLYKKREVISTEYVKKIIEKDEVIVDIGSNLGYFALLMSYLANNGKIYAIEPVPLNMEILKKNIELNNIRNITTYQLAIGDKDGESNFYFYDKFNSSSLEKLDEKLNLKLLETVKVKTTTLDDFIERFLPKNHPPTFIRMDIEGYEYNIIKNSPETLKLVHLKLFIELHPTITPEDKFQEMIRIMKKNNFKIKAIILEPSIKQYKYVKLLNTIRRKLESPSFGFRDNTYLELQKITKEKCDGKLMVFFEK